LTGGIRKGAKGEPPVAYFGSATARYSLPGPPMQFFQPFSKQGSVVFSFSSADFLA